MRTIDRASSFKRDYKREAKGQHRATLDDALKPVLVALATDCRRPTLDAATLNEQFSKLIKGNLRVVMTMSSRILQF